MNLNRMRTIGHKPGVSQFNSSGEIIKIEVLEVLNTRRKQKTDVMKLYQLMKELLNTLNHSLNGQETTQDI